MLVGKNPHRWDKPTRLQVIIHLAAEEQDVKIIPIYPSGGEGQLIIDSY